MHMSGASLEIYNLLINAGIAADKAEPLAKEIITRSEAKELLATKTDIRDLRVEIKGTENRLIMWMVGLQVAMAGLLVAAGLIG